MGNGSSLPVTSKTLTRPGCQFFKRRARPAGYESGPSSAPATVLHSQIYDPVLTTAVGGLAMQPLRAAQPLQVAVNPAYVYIRRR